MFLNVSVLPIQKIDTKTDQLLAKAKMSLFFQMKIVCIRQITAGNDNKMEVVSLVHQKKNTNLSKMKNEMRIIKRNVLVILLLHFF